MQTTHSFVPAATLYTYVGTTEQGLFDYREQLLAAQGSYAEYLTVEKELEVDSDEFVFNSLIFPDTYNNYVGYAIEANYIMQIIMAQDFQEWVDTPDNPSTCRLICTSVLQIVLQAPTTKLRYNDSKFVQVGD
jgi:hypothetical protein